MWGFEPRMEVVEGEEISQEEACDPGWKVAYGRRPGKSREAYSSAQNGGNTCGRRWDGGRTAAPRDAIRRATVASRLPPLPTDTFRIVVRPRDGLNVNKISRIRFEQALAMAAALAPAEIEEDTMCPNDVQNIFVVCTPHEKNADAYARAQQIRLGEGTFGVAAYLAPPENTCKGILRGVDVAVTEAQIRARIVNHRNPGALEARRIKNTTAVVVLFESMRVPNYVACGASIFRCTLYRRHTEVCYECSRPPQPSGKQVVPHLRQTIADGRSTVRPEVHFMRWPAPYGGQGVQGQISSSIYCEKTTEATEATRRAPAGVSTRGGWQEPLAYASSARAQHREEPLTHASSAEARRYKGPLSFQRVLGVQRENPGGAYLGGSCQREDEEGAAETNGGNAVGFAIAW
ncbi:hypothetical protein HPB52_006847 [Rhipicephalus sanguineus]|uniref:Uncharacterized protein n=1 Tax=Rhipicephalus sanguineus TaxID=34632 RepID=A0A9D4SU25_RHISA|nr:hypothetical protein HPB52_006847 [Rhipicephalus sanguineus]